MACLAFVLGRYYPETDANVTCCMNVIRVLQRQGHDVVCICGTSGETRTDTVHGVTVYRVHHDSYDELLKRTQSNGKRKWLRLKHFFHSMFVLPFFPNTELTYSRSLYRALREVGGERKIDCVIGVFRPFATVQAAIWYGKKYKTKTVGYYLDILKGADKPQGAPQGLYQKYCDFKERRVFRKLDSILMAENGRRIYEGEMFTSFREKMKYVNFPTLLFKEQCESVEQGCLVYAGTTNKTFRNPQFMVQVLLRMAQERKGIAIHMYGVSECANELNSYTERNPGVFFYHGPVDKRTADEAVWKAEYVVNIGNSDSVLVPSKIFELMGYGKPLIHIAKDRTDLSLQYIERYPEVCIVYEEEGIEAAVRKLIEFFDKRKEQVSAEYLKKEFFSATPEAIALELEQMVEQ